jgi:Mrp family chromosome partitioning ATPase
VIVCDLDGRRASVARLFALDGHAGVTDVALGRARLEDALAPISLDRAESQLGNSVDDLEGSLRILTLGRTAPPDPGEFVGSLRIKAMLEELKEAADIVLVDSPPILPVSDARTIASEVDGIIFVCRLKMVRRSMIRESARALERIETPLLGLVITGETTSAAKYEYPGYESSHDGVPSRHRERSTERS